MNLIIVPDIFGKTSPLRELVCPLSEHYEETIIVDPYDGEIIDFTNEDSAYRTFQEYCGLGKLSEKLENEITRASVPVDIVGFSVGGTCAWEISGKNTFKKIRQIVCFYGSRIRERLSISPQFPTSLIFPSNEKSFDIEPVIQALEKKQETEVVRTNYLHGFMNKKSTNFSETGYQDFSRWLIKKGSTTRSSGREIAVYSPKGKIPVGLAGRGAAAYHDRLIARNKND